MSTPTVGARASPTGWGTKPHPCSHECCLQAALCQIQPFGDLAQGPTVSVGPCCFGHLCRTERLPPHANPGVGEQLEDGALADLVITAQGRGRRTVHVGIQDGLLLVRAQPEGDLAAGLLQHADTLNVRL